jgi:3-dehydrosphinganine reductase
METNLMKTVVITGASSGMGLDFAKTYAKQGANVILLARNQTRLDNAVRECKNCADNAEQRILAFSVDVTDKEQLTACVKELKATVSVPDVLILSAGIVASVRFVEQTEQDFENILKTNVMGSRAVVQAFLPEMMANRQGNICFISSLGGLIPAYGYSGYSASKFALVGMAGAMRQELTEYNIGVSVVCPPEVDTPMVEKEAESILPQTRFIKDLGGTLSVEAVTQSVLKGIAKNRFMIIPGVMAKLSYWNARMFPRTFAAIMNLLIRLTPQK